MQHTAITISDTVPPHRVVSLATRASSFQGSSRVPVLHSPLTATQTCLRSSVMDAELSGGIVDGRGNSNSLTFGVKIHSVADRSILHEEAFRRMMTIESKRAERSRKPVLLTL